MEEHSKPHISIKAEKIFNLFGFDITNSFFLSLIVFLIFTIGAFIYYYQSKSKNKGIFYYFINFVVKSLYYLFYSVLKEKTDYFFPLLASFFLFILLQNWFGLLPGVGSLLIRVKEHGKLISVPLLRANTADLNTTLALAIISVFLSQVFAIKYLGFKGYINKFYRLKEPMSFFIGTLEVISEFSKVISFAFRLFGNVFAGEVLLTIIAFLIPILASFPFLLLEVFVGFIQALVFSMLTTVFISVAIAKHH
jgi:F-type H+-transporting ATPase subunit a